jgi:hypothetical protein
MIGCGKIEGGRRWFCCMCYVLQEENEPLQAAAPSVGRGQLKWYNPFVEETNYDYVAPSIAGLDKLGGHEPIYQRLGGKEREAVVMERRTRNYMRGAEVLLPDNFMLGSGIWWCYQ